MVGSTYSTFLRDGRSTVGDVKPTTMVCVTRAAAENRITAIAEAVILGVWVVIGAFFLWMGVA